MDSFVVAEAAAKLAVDESRRRLRPERKDTAEVVYVTNDARFVGGGLATIHIDGDPVDVNVTVPVTFGGTLVPGDRVVVEYDPPRGAVVSGKVSSGGNVVPSGSLATGEEAKSKTTSVLMPVFTGVPDSTETIVRFGTTDHLCGGVESFVDLVADDAWLSVPLRGVYSVCGMGQWESLAGPAEASCWLIRYTAADTELARICVDREVTADSGTTHNPVRNALILNANDRIRLVVYQTSGSAAVFGPNTAADEIGHLSVHWVTASPETVNPV